MSSRSLKIETTKLVQQTEQSMSSRSLKIDNDIRLNTHCLIRLSDKVKTYLIKILQKLIKCHFILQRFGHKIIQKKLLSYNVY